MRAFLDEFPLQPGTRILDVGGVADTWPGAARQAHIVLLNTARASDESFTPGFTCVMGDGCRLPFADQSFDIVFSNSVIEHVGSEQAQRDFASEVARVGKRYWVQTPNLYFPVEAHLLTPFVHWLPKRIAGWIVRRFTVWALLRRPDAERRRWYVDHFLHDIRLLSASQMRALFPGASIRKERVLLLAKSLIAVKR